MDRTTTVYSAGPRVSARMSFRTESGTESRMQGPKRTWSILPSRLIGRSSNSDCDGHKSSKNCEKPADMNMATQITFAVLIPAIFLFICVLVYFHRRNVRRQAMEDANEAHKSLDFGVENAANGKSKRKSKKLVSDEERPKRSRGLSIDMNLSSPYLLPDHVQGSRESMSSLVKTLQRDDPYRPVASYMSETGSIRSFEKSGRYTPSMITTSTRHMSRQSSARPSSPTYRCAPPLTLRQSSYTQSPLTPSVASSVTAVESIASDMPLPPAPVKELAAQESQSYHDEAPEGPTIPEIQQPVPVLRRDVAVGVAGSQQPRQVEDYIPHYSANASQVAGDDDLAMQPTTKKSSGVGLGLLSSDGPAPEQDFPITEVTLKAGPSHQTVATPLIGAANNYADYVNHVTVDETLLVAKDDDEQGRCRIHESPMDPGQDSKHLSVGFRPRPPDEMIESEDPEARANRIRSFYKEYFSDSKDASRQIYGGATNYSVDEAYCDSDASQFTMPFAQPVARRAMTPPPTGSRFPGAREGTGPRGPIRMGRMGRMGPRPPGGPPRGYGGSMSGMSMLRAGSVTMSYEPPRPASSASVRGPRFGCAMSGKPLKRLPPPAALNTLPTPSMLKDDHFALLNSVDFAPPDSFAYRARGRSQSPLGEHRPYAPRLPPASPLVSTFDDMAALPSPHLLRKSSTFTALDFAPPKKFKGSDTMSDAGSIRSNRSGVSQAASFAMRSGAGRVSRLPGDSVFTQASAADSLKPTWTMGGVDTKKQ